MPTTAARGNRATPGQYVEHAGVLRVQVDAAVRLACQACGFEPRINYEVGEQATALAMVAAGLGVTLVSDLGLSLCPPGVQIVALTEPVMRTVTHRLRSASPVVRFSPRAARARYGAHDHRRSRLTSVKHMGDGRATRPAYVLRSAKFGPPQERG